MPPRRRQFAVACALLLTVHGGAFGLLWTNAAPPVPDGRQVGADANASALLAAAVHNSAAFASTVDVRLRHPSNGSTAVRFHYRIDPAAGRLHVRTMEGLDRRQAAVRAAYLTGWGGWKHRDGRWRYESWTERRYRPDAVRLVRPAPSTARTVEKTVDDDGTVTVRLNRTRPRGMFLYAGGNTTTTYRIDFRDGHPYVASARAVPSEDDEFVVTVNRTLGATVERPDGLPVVTPREVGDRILVGALNS